MATKTELYAAYTNGALCRSVGAGEMCNPYGVSQFQLHTVWLAGWVEGSVI